MQKSIKESSKGCLVLTTIIVVCLVLTPIGIVFLGSKMVGALWKSVIGFFANDGRW